LLDSEYETPEHSVFKEDVFWMILERVRSKNEARVVRNIMPSLIPSAELLNIHGASNLQHLTEEINAEWTKCICLAGPRPKPDFAVGFMSSAFDDDEIEKLKSYTAPEKATLFTGKSYFPFVMCEVKCGENGLYIADRQNAHSASMAVNAIVELYRAVSRVMELHQKNLFFSISHDDTIVKIYGHYALIDGDKTTFYRHLNHSFDITALDGKDKETAYNFTRKLYDIFVSLGKEFEALPPNCLIQNSSHSLSMPARKTNRSWLVRRRGRQALLHLRTPLASRKRDSHQRLCCNRKTID